MVEDRWGNHDGVDEPTSTTNLNGTRPLPIIQTRIPKIAKSVTSDAPPPSREQDIADRERLRNNLINLQALLEKTSRKVGDVARNFRGRDINQCPVYAENLKLQQDVEKRIEEVKGNLFEISRRLGSLKEPKEEEKRGGEETVDVSIPRPTIEEEEDNSDKIFIDPGTHWCKQCDLFSTDVSSYLKHLQSDKHWKSCDSKEEPWRRTVSNKPKSDDHDKKVTVDIKGTHSLMPIRGFYCQVCGVLLGSQSHAEDHLKTNKHTRCYNRHVLMNGQVELNYSVSKSRALSKVQKRQRELEEKEEREKEAKKRVTENEMKKRALEDKDKENQRKRIKESSERSFQPTNEYSKKKEPDRERDRDREESKDREREKEREREKDRDRDKERDREKERERIKEKVKKSFSSSNKLSSHSKDRERNRAKDREREKDSHKNKLKRADDSRRSEKIVKSTTIIEPVEEDVFGPHWPFNDNKLAMKTSVFIPKKEWQLCYKKHIKLMMLGKLPSMSKKSDPKPDANSQAEKVQKPLSPPPSPEPAENVDSSIGDLVLSITCDKGSSDNEFDIDKDKDTNNDLKDMFTVEFDDEDTNAEKINESDFVVSQDVDFPKLEPLVINGDLNDSSIPNTPADDQMLSPPAWAQPLSLHDLAE